MTQSTEVPRITSADFLIALVAGLRLHSQRELYYRAQDWTDAAKWAFDVLWQADQADLVNCRFIVRPHAAHGDSQTIDNGMYFLQTARYISLQGWRYDILRIEFGEDHAKELQNASPIPADLLAQMTEVFLSSYLRY